MPYIPRARPAADPGAEGDTARANSEPVTADKDTDPSVPDSDESVSASAVVGASRQEPTRRSARVVMTATLGLAAIILGSLAIWAAVAAHRLRADAANANIAFVDQGATQTVTHDVTAAVNTIFSYNYADTARTRAAAQSLLTGAAMRQYNALFALVERQAPREKLVVTTRVTNIGVEFLTGGRARVLVFANEQDTRAGTGQTSYGGAMFAVTVGLQGGRWKIESIDTFTGP